MDEHDTVFLQTKQAIDVNLSPLASGHDRAAAASFIERLLNNDSHSPALLNIGLRLINLNGVEHSPLSTNYIRFGFQLLENVIKQNWNNMDLGNRQLLKDQIEQWVLADNFKERHLKDGLSKCIIEIIFREWPQNWPQLFHDLLRSEKNETVLYIWWRLSEDVGVFFRPSNPQRRREILHELNARTNDIMGYIGNCLQGADIILSITALRTLTGFLEWSAIDPSLITFLCNVMATDINTSNSPEKLSEAKLVSLECLLILFLRKGLKEDDKKALSVLFTGENFNSLVKTSSFLIEKTQQKDFSAMEFTLTKQLCSLLASAGQFVLGVPWFKDIPNDVLVLYFDTMNSFFRHPNQVFCSISLAFWRDFLKHTEAKKAFMSPALVEQLIYALPSKFIKQDSSELCSAFEFDAKEDYESFFFKFRADLIDFLRSLTQADEATCFRSVMTFMHNALNSPTASATEWDVIGSLLDSVCNRIKNLSNFAEQGLSSFAQLLNLPDNCDLEIVSYQLSCISALVVFAPHSPQPSALFQKLLQKIFSLASSKTDKSNCHEENKKIKNLRRHACSCLVKFSKTFPKLLLPFFADIHIQVNSLSQQSGISQTEHCALNESLLLISNEFESVDDQRAYVRTLLNEIQWILTFNITPEQLMVHLGLCSSREQYDDYGKARRSVIYAVNTLLGLLKRTSRKEVLLRQIEPFFESVVHLCANLNSIWRPEVQKMCHEDLRSAFEPATELEKVLLLEAPSATMPGSDSLNKSASHRIQSYLWALHENAFSVLGISIGLLSPDILSSSGSASTKFALALRDADHLPSLKLKMILKCLIKSLVQKCPADASSYETFLEPVVNYLVFVFRKANSRWDAVKERQQSLEEEHINNQEALDRELIEDQSNRMLSKEFIDIWSLLLIQSVERGHHGGRSAAVASAQAEKGEMKDLASEHSENDQAQIISEAGNYLLRTSLESVVVPTVVSLTWLDSNSSHKACLLNLVLVNKLIHEHIIKTKEEARFYLKHVLTALSYFGEHEQNQSRLLQLTLALYEGIVIKMGLEEAKLGFYEASGSSPEKWSDFEERLIKPSLAGKMHVSEKKKKEALKNLMGSVIGKSIGQLHAQNKAEIKNLQPFLFRRRKDCDDSKNVLNTEESALCRLFDR